MRRRLELNIKCQPFFCRDYTPGRAWQLVEGAVGISGFADLADVWFGFSVFALENWRLFGFGVLHRLRLFSNAVCGFRFLSTMMVVFRIQFFFVQCIYGFSGFAKDSPCSRTKTGVIPMDHLYSVLQFVLKEWMTKPSLLSSRHLGRKGKAQDSIKAKDRSSNITRLGSYLVDFDLRLHHRVATAPAMPFRRGNNIALTRSVHMDKSIK